MEKPYAGIPLLIATALVAIALPALIIWQTRSPVDRRLERGQTVVPSSVPTVVGSRRLFLDPIDPADAPEAEDAPKLVGIAGRLPDQAIAMVRMADGGTKVLAPGESHDGWTLTSLAPDAALFTRGKRRVRSFLAPVEPEPEVDEAAEAAQ